jgi:hypothetical protein
VEVIEEGDFLDPSDKKFVGERRCHTGIPAESFTIGEAETGSAALQLDVITIQHGQHCTVSQSDAVFAGRVIMGIELPRLQSPVRTA